MKIADVKNLLKCFGSAGIDNIENILEKFPNYGGLIKELYLTYKEGCRRYIELHSDREISEEKKQEILLEEFKKAIKKKEASEGRPPYMDCVLFLCKQGYSLSKEQQKDIRLILTAPDDLENCDKESIDTVEDFIDTYMGSEIDCDNVDECSIGDEYISFNFLEYDDHEYNEEDMQSLMKALNNLLGEEAFDFYHVDGH